MAQGSGCARGSKEATYGVGHCTSSALIERPYGETKPFKSDNKDRGTKAQKPKKAERVVIFMTLSLLVLATVHGSSCDIKVGGQCFFCIAVLFSREIEFTKFVSEEIATARSRHTSRRRRIPMPASPHSSARCNRHEARAGIVALISCCLVRLSTGGLGPLGEIISLPACTQRSIRRGALASRLHSLAFSGDKRGRSKALFSLCSTSISFSEPVNFSCDVENWVYGRAPL